MKQIDWSKPIETSYGLEAYVVKQEFSKVVVAYQLKNGLGQTLWSIDSVGYYHTKCEGLYFRNIPVKKTIAVRFNIYKDGTMYASLNTSPNLNYSSPVSSFIRTIEYNEGETIE